MTHTSLMKKVKAKYPKAKYWSFDPNSHYVSLEDGKGDEPHTRFTAPTLHKVWKLADEWVHHNQLTPTPFIVYVVMRDANDGDSGGVDLVSIHSTESGANTAAIDAGNMTQSAWVVERKVGK